MKGILSRFQYKVIRSLIDDLNAHGIDYAIVKGCPLAYYKTGNPGSRDSTDVDLLISRQDIETVANLLEKNGFQTPHTPSREERIMMIASSHQILSYSKVIGKLYVDVDVNIDLFWGEYNGRRIDIKEFLGDVVWIDIYGCPVKTLPPLKAMLQLVLHHYKEMNSFFYLTGARPVKKRFFEDVYLLYKRYSQEITVEKLYNYGEYYNITPYLYYMFYYTRMVYEDPELDAFLEAFYSEEGIRLLNCYGLTEKERKEWKISFEERLDTDISMIVYDEMSEEDKTKLTLSKNLFGFC